MSGWRWNGVSEAGYNAIHLVPVQVRGGSDSPYSIANQLQLSPDLFENKSSEDEQWRALEAQIDLMHKAGLLVVTDVVWNHTAHTSPWLAEHPEAGKSLPIYRVI